MEVKYVHMIPKDLLLIDEVRLREVLVEKYFDEDKFQMVERGDNWFVSTGNSTTTDLLGIDTIEYLLDASRVVMMGQGRARRGFPKNTTDDLFQGRDFNKSVASGCESSMLFNQSSHTHI
ncbi:hypothetical protein G7046_g5372 [Stylonectria norvegica]|nr:hypothetical protein G7046_g5372 [Stylonectria norvegica]